MELHEILTRTAMLGTLIGQLALISFGGIITVLPAVHHQVVEQWHWMGDRDFVNLFALAQASPGPNVLVLTLIGYKAASVTGATVATLALTLPTSLLAFAFVRVWDRFREARWRKAVHAGMLPVSVGFISASGFIIARAADTTPLAYAISIATLAVAIATKINPLWLFLVAGVLGLAGWL
jgi:chromate transporter